MRVTLNITQVKRKSLVTVVVIVSRFKSKFLGFLKLYFIRFFLRRLFKKIRKMYSRGRIKKIVSNYMTNISSYKRLQRSLRI